MPVKGIKRVKSNFLMKVKEISGGKTEKALYAVLSQGAAVSDTMTPVDTSNLINSRFAPQIRQSGGKSAGKVGYTAHYAAAVHDAPGTLKGQPRQNFGKTRGGGEFGGGTGVGNYWDPNAEPKFLEKGFEEIKPAIPAILKSIYKV